MIEKIILKKSAVLDKMPTSEQLDYGELSINYNAAHPFLSFKDSDGNITAINDYSEDIQDLWDNKLDVSYYDEFTSGITQNATDIAERLKITDFNTFKEDNTKTINTELAKYAKLTDTGQTITANKITARDVIVAGASIIDVTTDMTDQFGIALETLDAQKVNKSDIVQNTGQSTTSVMSQKASTDSFIANTPSGDPMHYMYECVGAVYNTGSDVVVSDPIVGNLTHKAGCWWCTGVGDLTNDDMRKVYGFGCNIIQNIYAGVKRCYNYALWRTTCTDSQLRYNEGYVIGGFDISLLFCFSQYMEIIRFSNKEIPINNMDYAFYECGNLRYIYPVISVRYCASFTSTFFSCNKLTGLKIRYLHSNIDFKYSRSLNIESIIYMIENATDATFTITLHPEAYERAIADAGVQTALSNKTNVSLAKGE